MTRTDANPVLNRLLQVLHRSLPVYLQGARPWIPKDRQHRLDVLARIAGDQRLYAQQVAEAVLQQGGRIELGQFPIEFTAIHDLSLDYLITRALESQRRDVETIRQCADALAGVPRLRALAEEILGNARRHLETLQEIAGQETQAAG